MNMAVKDVMTTQVTWVERDTPFAAIAAALRQYRVSAFPVALGGGEDRMPGMITGILRHKQLEKARGVTAADLMTALPVTVSPEDTVEHAARLMYLRGVKRLPVVDAEIAEDIRISVLSTEGAANPGAFDVLASFPVD
jgi:CBS domain-containing protein